MSHPHKTNDSTSNLITTLESSGLIQHIDNPTRNSLFTNTFLNELYVKTSKKL